VGPRRQRQGEKRKVRRSHVSQADGWARPKAGSGGGKREAGHALPGCGGKENGPGEERSAELGKKPK
jgi:hypothetical protein